MKDRQLLLTELTVLANSTFDLDEMLPRLCHAASDAIGLKPARSGGCIYLLDSPDTLTLAATTAPGSPARTLFPVVEPSFVAGQAVRERRALYDNQISSALPDYRASARSGLQRDPGFSAIAVLAAPIFIGDEVAGALALVADQPDHFGDADLSLATQIAHVIGGALRNARLYRREHEVAERLRQAERWRTAFLRIMAHELRTPLGQISGFTDLLGDEVERLSPRGQRYLAHIQHAAVHLGSLVQRSLDLVQLYADEAQLDRAPVEVGRLVGIALPTHRARAEAKGVEVRYVVPKEQVEVCGDIQRLQQALDILLDNAVKFTPAGGAVEVTVHRHDARVEVGVGDSGPGVAADVREYIFAAGQAEDAMTRRHGGTGLGLLMARRIATLHGGQLRLDAPMQGAHFVLSLPAGRTDGD